MSSKSYFESGYNGRPWSRLHDWELDIFYFHIDPIIKCAPLLDELRNAFYTLQKNYPSAIILDDGSIEAQIARLMAPNLEVLSMPKDHLPTPDFLRFCQSEHYISDPEILFALSYANTLKRPIVFPRWSLRIINVNVRFSKSPYLVYIENEKYHRMTLAQRALDLRISWNFLKNSAEIVRAYFMHPRILEWIKSDSNVEANNYHVERALLQDLYLQLTGREFGDIHKKHWSFGTLEGSVFVKHPEQVASFPLHLLYRKVFDHPLQINAREVEIYGG